MLDGAAYDPRTIELLRLVRDALDPIGGYAIGGSFAMRVYGYARYTSDVDVFALDEHRGRILHALRNVGLTISPVFAPFHYIATLPSHGDPDVRVDVLFPADDPELSAVEQPERAKLAGMTFNVFPINLLVAAKFYSDRPRDHRDLEEMFHRGMFDPVEVNRVLEHLDPDAAQDFRAEIKEISTPRTPRRRPKRR